MALPDFSARTAALSSLIVRASKLTGRSGAVGGSSVSPQGRTFHCSSCRNCANRCARSSLLIGVPVLPFSRPCGWTVPLRSVRAASQEPAEAMVSGQFRRSLRTICLICLSRRCTSSDIARLATLRCSITASTSSLIQGLRRIAGASTDIESAATEKAAFMDVQRFSTWAVFVAGLLWPSKWDSNSLAKIEAAAGDFRSITFWRRACRKAGGVVTNDCASLATTGK